MRKKVFFLVFSLSFFDGTFVHAAQDIGISQCVTQVGCVNSCSYSAQIDITSNVSVVESGDAAVISWTTTSGAPCVKSGSWSGTTPGGVGISGSQTVYPTGNPGTIKAYSLGCMGRRATWNRTNGCVFADVPVTETLAITIANKPECGSNAGTYTYNQTAFPSSSQTSFCRYGRKSPSVVSFPSQGGSSSWTCEGDGVTTKVGSSVSCLATRGVQPRINGACGDAATTFEYNRSSFIEDFCSSGTASPSKPSFPAQGGSTTWKCLGSGGGSDVSCNATRDLQPVCGPAQKTYEYNETSFSGAFCSAGVASPLNPSFPSPGGTSNWYCYGHLGGSSRASCSAGRKSPPPPVGGSCGPAATVYAYNQTSFSGSFCSSGTANPSNPSFPAQGGSTSWTCSGSNGGANASCSAARDEASVNGACGSAEKTYAYDQTSFSGSFCSSGTANPSNPSFPAQGGSTSWTCSGSNGGATENCIARRNVPPPPLNGACGSAEKTYAYDQTSYSGSFCSSGTANPSNPSFPAQGGSTSWTCSGSNGGANANCIARRNVPPPPEGGSCGPAATVYAYNQTSFSGSFCSSGTANPSNPSFPAQGGSTSWTCSGSNGGANASCSAARDLAPANVTLTVTKSGSGVGTVSSSPSGINCGSTCTYSFPVGTSVTLTEIPGVSTDFAGWTGSCSGNGTTCTITMDAPKTVGVTFNAVPVCVCSGSASDHCTGEYWSNSCGAPSACGPGTKDCRKFWEEVAP